MDTYCRWFWFGQRPIAFIDRDGVLNYGRNGYVNHPHELKIIPGSGKAIARLRSKGYAICVVTNQSPIMRKLWSVERLYHTRSIA